MSMVKKTKLALLTSVVILSAKDVYAMDPSSSSSHHPSRVYKAILPDDSFSPGPLARLEPNEEGVKEIILNATGLNPSTVIDEQSRQELRTILSKITNKEILRRLEGIQHVFLLKLEDLAFLRASGDPLYARRDYMDPALMKGMYNIVIKILPLPKDEIIARGVAIKKMVDTLFHPLYEIAGITDTFNIADSFTLINYAFGLTVDQINERTTIINAYKNYLVPQDNETRPRVIESLFKHDSRSLLERIAYMSAYEEEVWREHEEKVRRTRSSSNRFNAENAKKALNERKVRFSQLTLNDLKKELAAKLNETTHGGEHGNPGNKWIPSFAEMILVSTDTRCLHIE